MRGNARRGPHEPRDGFFRHITTGLLYRPVKKRGGYPALARKTARTPLGFRGTARLYMKFLENAIQSRQSPGYVKKGGECHPMDEKQPIDGRSPTKRLEPITARWPPTPLITYHAVRVGAGGVILFIPRRSNRTRMSACDGRLQHNRL